MRSLPHVRAEHAMRAEHAHHAGGGGEPFFELLIMATARVPRASSSRGDSHSWRTHSENGSVPGSSGGRNPRSTARETRADLHGLRRVLRRCPFAALCRSTEGTLPSRSGKSPADTRSEDRSVAALPLHSRSFPRSPKDPRRGESRHLNTHPHATTRGSADRQTRQPRCRKVIHRSH